MAAGHTGKVPGAPPRNPAEARSRKTREKRKLVKVPFLKYTSVSGGGDRNPNLKRTPAGC